MLLVDHALKAAEARSKPIRVAIVGAGFMSQGLANQIAHSTPGMRIVAISNRKPQRALDVLRYAGFDQARLVGSPSQLDADIAAGRPSATEDALLLCRSDYVDVVVDATGSVEFGAHVAMEAFKHGKDVVLMNAELDATIGPILQVYARKYDVMLSACDGDEPGVQMNLFRWVKGLGLIPRVIGNIKGLQDPYRNPTTQKGFAERWGQNPAMVTSFADGSKISFEQTIVANATGFKVKSRGMSRGLEYRGDIMKIGELYDIDELRDIGGIVDYVVGTPLTKVYVLAEHPDPKQQHYLNLYKMGEGPLYSFFTPYHLVHFEVPNTIARVVLVSQLARPTTGRTGGRGLCRRQARPESGRGARRARHVHDVWRGGERRGDERRTLPPRGTCRRLQAEAPHRQGLGPHLRRRGATARPACRPAARRAIPQVPQRNLARGPRSRPRVSCTALRRPEMRNDNVEDQGEEAQERSAGGSTAHERARLQRRHVLRFQGLAAHARPRWTSSSRHSGEAA